MPGRLILETERLLLREFEEDDAEAFLSARQQPESSDSPSIRAVA